MIIFIIYFVISLDLFFQIDGSAPFESLVKHVEDASCIVGNELDVRPSLITSSQSINVSDLYRASQDTMQPVYIIPDLKDKEARDLHGMVISQLYSSELVSDPNGNALSTSPPISIANMADVTVSAPDYSFIPNFEHSLSNVSGIGHLSFPSIFHTSETDSEVALTLASLGNPKHDKLDQHSFLNQEVLDNSESVNNIDITTVDTVMLAETCNVVEPAGLVSISSNIGETVTGNNTTSNNEDANSRPTLVLRSRKSRGANILHQYHNFPDPEKIGKKKRKKEVKRKFSRDQNCDNSGEQSKDLALEDMVMSQLDNSLLPSITSSCALSNTGSISDHFCDTKASTSQYTSSSQLPELAAFTEEHKQSSSVQYVTVAAQPVSPPSSQPFVSTQKQSISSQRSMSLKHSIFTENPVTSNLQSHKGNSVNLESYSVSPLHQSVASTSIQSTLPKFPIVHSSSNLALDSLNNSHSHLNPRNSVIPAVNASLRNSQLCTTISSTSPIKLDTNHKHNSDNTNSYNIPLVHHKNDSGHLGYSSINISGTGTLLSHAAINPISSCSNLNTPQISICTAQTNQSFSTLSFTESPSHHEDSIATSDVPHCNIVSVLNTTPIHHPNTTPLHHTTPVHGHNTPSHKTYSLQDSSTHLHNTTPSHHNTPTHHYNNITPAHLTDALPHHNLSPAHQPNSSVITRNSYDTTLQESCDNNNPVATHLSVVLPTYDSSACESSTLISVDQASVTPETGSCFTDQSIALASFTQASSCSGVFYTISNPIFSSPMTNRQHCELNLQTRETSSYDHQHNHHNHNHHNPQQHLHHHSISNTTTYSSSFVCGGDETAAGDDPTSQLDDNNINNSDNIPEKLAQHVIDVSVNATEQAKHKESSNILLLQPVTATSEENLLGQLLKASEHCEPASLIPAGVVNDVIPAVGYRYVHIIFSSSLVCFINRVS